MTIGIVIDDRERGDALATALARQLGRPPAVARLELGDIAIGDAYLIERKTAPDFIASLLERRLDDQLDRLARIGAGRALVFVEGPFNQHVLGGMDPGKVRQAMLSIQLDWRLALIRTRDAEHSAQWIVDLVRRAEAQPVAALAYRPSARPAAAPPVAPRRPGRASDPHNLQLAALRRIEGVGGRKAAALLDKFGSLQRIKVAPIAELAEVAGVGPALAIHIHHALNR